MIAQEAALFPDVLVPPPRRKEHVQDARLRGTGQDQERAFRETLWDWIETYKTVLPSPLYLAILDHLTRTDRMGLSLCFNGPLRQAMLAEVTQWLATVEQPAARVRWQALTASQQQGKGAEDLSKSP